MENTIKRGHTSTELPKDAINVVFRVSVRKENGRVYCGYGYVMYVPQMGLVMNGGSRQSDYRKSWYDCIKDILNCTPPKAVVMVHTRYRNFVTALVGDQKLPTNTEKEKRWQQSIISLCEKKHITLYMHTLHSEIDRLERQASKIAHKRMNVEYQKYMQK